MDVEIKIADTPHPRHKEWLEDPEVNKYLEVAKRGQVTWKQIEKYIDSCATDYTKRLFYIYYKKNAVGTISIYIDWVHRHGEVGLIVGEKQHWGKGIGTKAIALVKDIAFNDLNLHRLYAGVDEENKSSLAVFKKNGFVDEGCWIDHRFIDGKYTNEIKLGVINEETD
jgi:RimJ/RimL family protein N-acetyltransferase